MPNHFELELLRHIDTYRITTSDAVARLYEIGNDIVVEQLLRLIKLGLVGTAELLPGRCYYFLHPKAADVLGREKINSGQLSGTNKVNAYATLHFCCLSDRYRPKITTEVFKTHFSRLYRPGPKINYYTDGANIGYIRVETNASLTGDVFRLIERCRRDVNKRTSSKNSNSQFRELVKRERFQITVLTAFEQKVSRVRSEINRMNERCKQYQAYANAKAAGQLPAPHLQAEYDHWHGKKKQGGFRRKDRKAPVPPPPMTIYAVPRLIELMYPKSDQPN